MVNVTSNPPLVRLLHLKAGALVRPPVLSVKANLRPEAGGAAGLVVAFDPVRYTVRAVLDSADITAMRTGAIAAVVARQLAGPGPRRLALLGAGPVARQSLAALSQVVELEQVRVWSRAQGRSEKISSGTARAIAVGLAARIHGDPRSPVAGTDHGGQHGDRDLFRRARPAAQRAQVVVDIGAGPDLGDAVGRGQVAGGE